jgi:transcriptional regulator with XRE-family HTH domain
VQPEDNFFKGLGSRIRQLRRKAGYSQEDMISYGFSVRYWQKIEAGKPITLRTLIRICRLFSAPMHDLVRGLDVGGAGESMVIPKGSRRKKKSGE